MMNSEDSTVAEGTELGREPLQAKVFQLSDLPTDRIGSTYRMAAIAGDGATVGMHWFEPDHPAWPAPHSHPYDQLAFVLEGSMRFTLGDEIRIVHGPAVVWIPADLPHSADVVGDKPCFNLDVFGLVRGDFAHLFPIGHEPAES
jgi:quercetin dioxygenase-like cupin family protein